jgi:hypothetical protein
MRRNPDNLFYQVEFNDYNPINKEIWEIIQVEGWDEELGILHPFQYEYTTLTIPEADVKGLKQFTNETLNKYNQFDITLKQTFPNHIDLIDYDNGVIVIVRVRQGTPMRRNPRPIPVNKKVVTEITQYIMDFIQGAVDDFEGLSEDSDPLKKIHDEDLPLNGYSIYDLFWEEFINNVRGDRLYLEKIEVAFTGEDSKEFVTGGEAFDLRWLREEYNQYDEDDERHDIAKIAYENKIVRLRVKFSVEWSPRKIRKKLNNRRSYLKIYRNVFEVVLHEFTHLIDYYEFTQYTPLSLGYEEYLNQPQEVRAEIQTFIHRLENLFVGWGRKKRTKDFLIRWSNQNIQEAFAPILPNNFEYYTDINQIKFLSAGYQWLQENGFDLPRRRF